MIAFEHRLDIKSRSATKNGNRPPTLYSFIGIEEILLILKQVILRTRLPDIYQMIRNLSTDS